MSLRHSSGDAKQLSGLKGIYWSLEEVSLGSTDMQMLEDADVIWAQKIEQELDKAQDRSLKCIALEIENG